MSLLADTALCVARRPVTKLRHDAVDRRLVVQSARVHLARSSAEASLGGKEERPALIAKSDLQIDASLTRVIKQNCNRPALIHRRGRGGGLRQRGGIVGMIAGGEGRELLGAGDRHAGVLGQEVVLEALGHDLHLRKATLVLGQAEKLEHQLVGAHVFTGEGVKQTEAQLHDGRRTNADLSKVVSVASVGLHVAGLVDIANDLDPQVDHPASAGARVWSKARQGRQLSNVPELQRIVEILT
mmetsp:Transcript_43006/g.69444  ORF Transcript_43006/g.69444 Transcript_43006/m.69444 type:complete len:241 (-) Transcript_43006:902-1624(-)